jgi:hypothetical protein
MSDNRLYDVQAKAYTGATLVAGPGDKEMPVSEPVKRTQRRRWRRTGLGSKNREGSRVALKRTKTIREAVAIT